MQHRPAEDHDDPAVAPPLLPPHASGPSRSPATASPTRPETPRDGMPPPADGEGVGTPIILSFDVEPHHRIEAAAGLALDPASQARYEERLGPSTRRLLDRLDVQEIKATFFVVGQIARSDPGLVRDIHRRGHEVASHSWDHRRLHGLTPGDFRDDVRRSREALEQVTGEAVVGYRAPTFSVVRETAWAIDVLAGSGLLYDSSIYPVRHDRYGVPRAPRAPFLAAGADRAILEIPPLTLRCLGMNLPVGGGGYFRLLPLALMELALRRARRDCRPPVAMLYFHPWEFDPGQPRLPLGRAGRFRTYVGIRRSEGRLSTLLGRHRFARAADVAVQLGRRRPELETYNFF
jgi:polysaccharide deacetylase family protein (PEP-CTERM system associated)